MKAVEARFALRKYSDLSRGVQNDARARQIVDARVNTVPGVAGRIAQKQAKRRRGRGKGEGKEG